MHASPSAYYRDVCLQGVPHVLLDVRSPVQFHTVSFDWYRSQAPADAARAQLVAAVTRTARLVHAPLSDLKRAAASADASAALASLVGTDGGAPSPVYVLCRRGIDSVAAAQLLLDAGLRDVINIEGGLTAWHATIDDVFPIY